MERTRICVVVTDKAQLGRLLTLMRELKRSRRFRLQVVVSGSALTYRYGNVVQELRKEGFRLDAQLPTVIEGGEHVGMAKTAALGMLEFATAFERLRSDMVVVRGDRFEMLPIAAAAAYQNKIVVHLEGGDRTGSIDESVRHAISKLAHVHFVTNKEALDRLVKMGERRDMVFNVGSLDVDFLTRIRFSRRPLSDVVNQHGVGAELDLSVPYLVVMQNPVTTEASEARRQIQETLAAVHASGMPAVWVWPNLGAGSDAMAKRMREWQIRYAGRHMIRFVRYLAPEEFLNVVQQAGVVVGNSSTGIKECAWLGVPVVNIGSRQHGRLRADNVMDVPHDRVRIGAAIQRQVRHGRYGQSKIYGNGSTAKRIVETLGSLEVAAQKENAY